MSQRYPLGSKRTIHYTYDQNFDTGDKGHYQFRMTIIIHGRKNVSQVDCSVAREQMAFINYNNDRYLFMPMYIYLSECNALPMIPLSQFKES